MRKQNTTHKAFTIIGITVVVLLLLTLVTLLAAVNSSQTTNPPVVKVKSTIAKVPQNNSNTQPSSPSNILFFDPLNGPNRIVTNEYVHWTPNSNCPYTSNIWDMTSGTLFIKNNAGYSGIPTLEKQSYCNSTLQNDSSIFRLNTKENNFANVDVSMDYMAVAHGGGGAPVNPYDGIHLWVGYQSEYALYAVTIFRWDENLVIKKKIPRQLASCADPANDGCYYNLTSETTHKSFTTAGVWYHADILFQVNTNGTTTITERIDGQTILTGTDNDVQVPAYTSGAVGLRGDNTEFYFKNFTVARLQD